MKILPVISSMFFAFSILLGTGSFLAVQIGATEGIAFFTFFASYIFTLQGIFTLAWMLSYWENPRDNWKKKNPKEEFNPQISFTALLPVRHEENVIAQTIEAVANIEYPENMKEVLVLCRNDDDKTIKAANEKIKELNNPNIKLITFFDLPINKPHALNIGLEYASNSWIGIFDAEDQPDKNLYKAINSEAVKSEADVIQSGVQLMNYRSNWFSIFNVLEYFFWFKSGLNFFKNLGGVTPLGGNTIFFKKESLKNIGGWDEKCLTEDAEIAMRLGAAGAKLHIVYDEKLATQEETPESVESMIKQRTRWNQGFLQVLFKGDWATLPKISSRLVVLYILLSPLTPIFNLTYMPVGFIIGLLVKEPIPVSLFSFLPFYIFWAQISAYLFGLNEFSRNFGVKVPLKYYLRVVLFYFPYQILLLVSASRAIYKFASGATLWEKTYHANAHRNNSLYLKPA